MKKALGKLGKWLWNLHHICTIIVVAELVIATGLYLYYTKNFLDPVTTAGMNVIPTECSRAAAVSSDKTDIAASVSDGDITACLKDFSPSKRRAEGKPPAKMSEVITGCCDVDKLDNAALGDCTRRVNAASSRR